MNRLQAPGCDAEYRLRGEVADPFEIFHRFGMNLVRVRLFNDPDYRHGDLADATRTIRRAKEAGMGAMLALHYSDEFADPSRQNKPRAWLGITDPEELGQELYDFTYETLIGLANEGLMPELVQVGNEALSNMLLEPGEDPLPLNWERNSLLFNAGFRAVRDAAAETGDDVRIVLSLSQPENVDWWLERALANGVTDFDVLGFSYYSVYSDQDLADAIENVGRWRREYDREVLLVETGYPFTLTTGDRQNNLLFTDALEDGYPASPTGQRDYLTALTQGVIDEGGLGVIYWEPAWVSAPCETAFGVGSAWENAAMFDYTEGAINNAHEGITFYSHDYRFDRR